MASAFPHQDVSVSSHVSVSSRVNVVIITVFIDHDWLTVVSMFYLKFCEYRPPIEIQLA